MPKRKTPATASLQEVFDLCTAAFEEDRRWKQADKKWKQDVDEWRGEVDDQLLEIRASLPSDDASADRKACLILVRLNFTFLDTTKS